MKIYHNGCVSLIKQMKKAMSSKEVILWIALGSENIRVGTLRLHVKGHKESTSFEYDKKWLDHPERFALEPALKLTEGGFHTGQSLSLFGGFGNSAPDRFARVLMRRFEAAKAKKQNRLPPLFLRLITCLE